MVMHRLKQRKPVALLLIFLLLLSACGSGGESAPDDTFTINIAYGNQPGEPIDQVARKWKELAEAQSGGQLRLNLYPSSQLGSEADVIEQALFGSNVIILTGFDFLMRFIPDFGVLTAPYIVDDVDDLFYLTTTDWFKGLENELRDEGFEFVSTKTFYGERHLMTTKPVKTPEDLKGMKIRVPNNQMSINTFKALGASPTPLPLSDLYASLQQGIVDGAENPLPVLSGSKTQEVAKYLALTGHTKIVSPWVAGTKFTEKLPDHLLDILRSTADEAGQFGREIVRQEEEKVLEQFEAQGITITEVDLGPFKEKGRDIFSRVPQWSPDLEQTIRTLLENKP